MVKIIPSSVLDRSIDQERLIASVMELVDVPDSKSGAARRGGSSPPRGTIPLLIFSPDQLGSRVAFAMIISNKSF